MTLLEPPPVRLRKTSRLRMAIILILALAVTGFTRWWAMNQQDADMHPGGLAPREATTTSLSSLPSFATILLLGGLRGPLVMFLWPSTETQKQQHDLEDMDTEIEWIRMLQPEFDTVHLFQIWNKAYNLSVQMSSLHDKYTTILDGIDYGMKVDRERPDDMSIIHTVAQVWEGKLGTSSEHIYYRRRVRRESQSLIRVSFPVNRQADFQSAAIPEGWSEDDAPLSTNDRTQRVSVLLEPLMAERITAKFNGPGIDSLPDTQSQAQDDPTWRRVRMDPMLDLNGNLLPQYTQARYPRPSNLPASVPWYDGSELQYLEQYAPFHYGLSPLALAYNGYKRAQMLQTLWNERSIQVGDTVIDSRPGIVQKMWAMDEWERGRRYEIGMWGLTLANGQPVDPLTDPSDLEQPAQSTPITTPMVSPWQREAAIETYGLAARLMADSCAELKAHIARYSDTAQTYFVHIDDATSGQAFMQADHDYLAAMTADGQQQKDLLTSARAEYDDALHEFAVTVLKYYVDDGVIAMVFPKDPKTGRQFIGANIDQIDRSQWLPLLADVLAANVRYFADPNTHQYDQGRDQHHEEREPYLSYMLRCKERMIEIDKVLKS
ncbi:MAG: hypothetical protein ABSG31_13405 [Tepidisphaeraceae bacterium]